MNETTKTSKHIICRNPLNRQDISLVKSRKDKSCKTNQAMSKCERKLYFKFILLNPKNEMYE